MHYTRARACCCQHRILDLRAKNAEDRRGVEIAAWAVLADITKMIKYLTLLTVGMLAMLAARSDVQAQQQVPSYRPNSPTLSPYLYLTRPNAGPFPNYQTFVQPLENQRTTNQMAQQQLIQLQQNQQQLQQTQQQEFAPT